MLKSVVAFLAFEQLRLLASLAFEQLRLLRPTEIERAWKVLGQYLWKGLDSNKACYIGSVKDSSGSITCQNSEGFWHLYPILA